MKMEVNEASLFVRVTFTHEGDEPDQEYVLDSMGELLAEEDYVLDREHVVWAKPNGAREEKVREIIARAKQLVAQADQPNIVEDWIKARFRCFLYVLMRDHMPTGVVHALIKEHVKGTDNPVFSAVELEMYAERMVNEALE